MNTFQNWDRVGEVGCGWIVTSSWVMIDTRALGLQSISHLCRSEYLIPRPLFHPINDMFVCVRGLLSSSREGDHLRRKRRSRRRRGEEEEVVTFGHGVGRASYTIKSPPKHAEIKAREKKECPGYRIRMNQRIDR